MIEPTKLATKIAAKIAKEQPVTYTELEARAVEKGIDLGVFQNAIVIIHRSKVIEVKDVKGELTYTIKAKADPKPELSKPTYSRADLGESPFKVCSCALTHIHWSSIMGHFPLCDSIIYTTEYKKQNPWDITAGLLINLEWYEKETAKQKAIRRSYKR